MLISSLPPYIRRFPNPIYEFFELALFFWLSTQPNSIIERAPKPIFSKMGPIAARALCYLLFDFQPTSINKQHEIPRALAGG